MASVARSWPGTPQEVAWWGLILGALAFLNTWDYPIYLLLFGAALAVWRYRVDIGKQGWLRDTAILMLAVGASGVLAYFPFFLSLRSQAGGIGLVSPETKTAPQQFLLMFGIQFSLLPATLTVIAAEMRAALKSVAPPSLAWIWAAAFGLALVASLVAGWWTAALCLLFLLVSGGLLLWGTVVGVRESAGGPDAPTLMVLLMIMVAMGLLCAVEVVYLRDVFDSRMNTVFKFYYQAWVLLSLCGSYGVYRLVRKAGELRRPWQAAVALWLALSGMLVIGGLSYTAAATATKAGLFRGEATLNGTAYVARQRPAEYAAIAWLLADAAPDAVIVEGSGGSYTVENWVSAHTGLQSLLGWAGHERQWRGSGDLPAEREQVLRAIYSGVDMAETDRLLRDYGVDYVLVGPYEREAYDAGDDTLAKLDGLMVRAYQNEVYVIYARAR